jgi:hypothetical protein
LTVAKGTGLSREPRIRAKQEKTLSVYAEQAPRIGADPALDRQAKIIAVERGGYTRPTTDAAKVRQFEKLFKSDAAREYLAELWGIAVEQEPDPVSLAFRMLHEHMMQTDESWGPKDRAVSLAATRQTIAIFVPNQTSKVLTGHVSAKVDRPETYDQEPVMEARSILPAGQTISKPQPPTGGDEDDDGEGDGNDDD